MKNWSSESLWNWELEYILVVDELFLLQGQLGLGDGLLSRLGHGSQLGVSLESIDEGLHVSNLFELHFSLSHSFLSLLSLGLLILIKVTLEICELLVLELNNLIDDLVEEVLGVRNDDDSDVKGENVLLEPDEGDQVQMIGWLIQEENLWLTKHDLCDGDSHSPSSGELSRWGVNVLFGKSKTDENHGSLLFSLMSIDMVKSLVKLHHSNIVVGLDILVITIITDELVLLSQEIFSLLIALEHVVQNALLVTDDFLLDLEDMKVLGHAVELLSANGVDEGGLSGSVSSNETVLAASGEFNSGVDEQLQGASDQGDT